MLIKINFTTNFKPGTYYKNMFQEKDIFKKRNNFFQCKNFLIYVILLKHLLVYNSGDVVFFVKPKSNKLVTILRPPYKNKISRHQLTISRYYIIVSFNLKTDLMCLNSLNQLVCLKNFKKFYNFFETNVMFQYKTTLTLFLRITDLFMLENYK